MEDVDREEVNLQVRLLLGNSPLMFRHSETLFKACRENIILLSVVLCLCLILTVTVASGERMFF